MRPTVIHVAHRGQRWWVVFDLVVLMRGAVGESRAALLRRWERQRGRPADGYARVVGLCNPVQAGLNVGLLWRDAAPPT